MVKECSAIADPSVDVDRPIPDVFQETVETAAESIAFSSDDHVLTFKDVSDHANALAFAIIEAVGPGPGRVALVLDQGADFFVAAMAVLKTGRSFVSFDPKQPEERLKRYFELAEIELVISNSLFTGLAEAVSAKRVPVLELDLSEEPVAAQAPNVHISPESEAFVIFTSGSTGAPKGVRHSHRGVVRNAAAFAREYQLSTVDRVLVVSTPSVYAAHRDMFLCLLGGASARHYPLRDKGFGALADFVANNQITVLPAVVTVFRNFLNSLKGDEKFPTVRILKFGGEASLWEDVDRAYEVFPKSARIFTGFSMTETNLTSSFWTTTETERSGTRIPVGRPLSDTDVEIIDEDGRPVPDNTPGEICYTGKYLSIGYLATSHQGMQNFEELPGDTERLRFRTGDLGLIDSDGNLTLLGRVDNQVKIRGYRVDLLEVEITLQQLPGVASCVVKCHDKNEPSAKIVAYVKGSDGCNMSVVEIREFLAKSLPRQALPSHIVMLEEMPLTTTGKVDRQSLELPNQISRNGLGDFSPSRNPLDELLIGVWESRIGIQGIGIDDDFFDIGGDSLTATQLLLEIDELYVQRLDADDILNSCNTVRKMSDRLSSVPRAEVKESKEPRDINFVDGDEVIEDTNRPELYMLDRESGLRVGRPGAKQKNIQLNNLGFRGPDIEAEKTAGRLRVAFLGSSSVFDPNASSNEHTWPYLAVENLKGRFPELDIDHVNAALPGYSTLRCQRMFERFVAPLEPDIVVVQVSDLNRDTAYLARSVGLFDGVPYRPSSMAKKFKPILIFEKNLIVSFRQLFSLVPWNKLEIQETLADSYKERLRTLLETCREGDRQLLLTECRRLDRSMSLWKKLKSLSSRCLYMPYMSLKGFLKAEDLYERARKKVSASIGCKYLDASGLVPADSRHFADSTHFRDPGSQKMAELVAEALVEIVNETSLF